MKNQLEKQVGTNFDAKLACEGKKCIGERFSPPKDRQDGKLEAPRRPKRGGANSEPRTAERPDPSGRG